MISLNEIHGGCFIRGKNWLQLASTLVQLRVLVGSVLLNFFAFCVVLLCFVCLHPVSCVPNVASVCGLSILDCSFYFI